MTAIDPMPIKALAPWFGSKRTLAPRIIEQLGEHRVYWECFGGSCAVLLNKAPAMMETVNDLHGDLINLARVVRDDVLAPRLFDLLGRSLMHEDLMDECADRYRQRGNAPAADQPDFDRAADYILSAWMGRNGVAGTTSYNQGFCVRYTANGGHSAKRFQSVIDSIPAWWVRLRQVTILNRNARELLKKIEDEHRTAIYLDPPYVEKGASYIHDFTVGAREESLFGGTDDQPMSHGELAELASRFTKARVVISYYDHPMVRRLYRGWTFIPCPTTKSLLNQSARNRTTEQPVEAPEMLIVNGPAVPA